LIDGDCDVAAGQACREGSCVQVCAVDGDCVGGVCENEICVQCRADANCAIGSICADNSCVEGCRSDRDCPAEDTCRDGQCVLGCRATPDDTCPLGSRCTDAVCVLGCGVDDTRCADGQVCRNDACLDACASGADCDRGSACLDGACVVGCLSNEDCGGFGSTTPICVGETATVPGTCAQCDVDGDCLQGLGLVCDDSKTCRAACNDQGGCFVGVCDTSDDLCVECLTDADCGAFELCDAGTRSCVAEEALCAPCQRDDECGTGNLCLSIRTSNFTTDRGCGLDCSAGQVCPSGSSCQDISDGGVLRGRQCVPDNSVVDTMSCQAYRTLESQTPCRFSATCGTGGLCINDLCAVPCDTVADCPYGSTCEQNPDGDRPPRVCIMP
jgi:Cys-rich repeat protein